MEKREKQGKRKRKIWELGEFEEFRNLGENRKWNKQIENSQDKHSLIPHMFIHSSIFLDTHPCRWSMSLRGQLLGLSRLGEFGIESIVPPFMPIRHRC